MTDLATRYLTNLDGTADALTDLAIRDVTRRQRIADQLDAKADRPCVGIPAVEASRVDVLRSRARRYMRDALTDSNAIFRFLTDQLERSRA